MALLLAAAASLRADIKLHALFGDNMVMQQGRQANIWGTAEAGEKVSVRFRDQEVAGTADARGHWVVQVDAKTAGGPFAMTIAGQNTIELKNVRVGEVWVCSGQSNMGWPLAPRPHDKGREGTENPSICLFTVPARSASEPMEDLVPTPATANPENGAAAAGRWHVCGPDSAGPFSAVAYFFGRDLQRSLGVPVGLIHASYGGSPVGQWISARAVAEDPQLQSFRESRAAAAAKLAQQTERMRPEIDRYRHEVARAKQEGKQPPPAPRGMGVPTTSGLYNGMIAPLLKFSIRGVIWYQGEANVGQPELYRSMFPAMIRGWRHEFGQGDFPFLFVQVAPYLKIVEEPQDSSWARLREAQLWTSLSVPNTAMTVITDWGHEVDIHPKPKQPVGERLARLARGVVYGEPIVHSGPLCTSANAERNNLVLTFTNTGSGLVARRLALEDQREDSRLGKGGALHVAADRDEATVPLQGFCIAGADGRFVNAMAEIRGDTVVVSSPKVERPSDVRYGWADYPTGNLFNREGLPATPFRTDGPPLVMEIKE
jgi:sialate O-acetylesterase